MTPAIGEVRTADELGRTGKHLFVWHACEICGACRWVQTVRGMPKGRICRPCGARKYGRQWVRPRAES